MASSSRPCCGRCSSPPAGAAHGCARTPQAPPVVDLPNRRTSFKFAVLGDFGTGDRAQYQLGEQMAKLRARFPFELVITVGDNIYGGERPQDMQRKFEQPVQGAALRRVKFYASLGNHDDREQARYALFNMDGKTYYTFKAPRQRAILCARERLPEAGQMAWVEKELAGAGEKWNIPYFHHPLYASGKRHGSHTELPGARTDVPEGWGHRSLRGPRTLLRAYEAPERHRLLRHRLRAASCERATSTGGPD